MVNDQPVLRYRQFLDRLTRMYDYDRHRFESEGDALIQTLRLLRGWQSQRGT